MLSALLFNMYKVLVSVTIRGFELETPKNPLSSASAMQMDLKFTCSVYMFLL